MGKPTLTDCNTFPMTQRTLTAPCQVKNLCDFGYLHLASFIPVFI